MTTSVCPLTASNNNDNNNNTKTANTTKTTTTSLTAKPQPPLNARRRPKFNIQSSLLLLALFIMCQLQQFAGGGCGVFTMAAPAPAPASVPLNSPTPSPAEAGPLSSLLKLTTSTVTDKSALTNRTRRIQKRHREIMTFNERFHMELNSSVLDWSNGCGGVWKGPEAESNMVRPHKRCAKHKKLLRNLQNKTGRELRLLKDDNKHPVQALNISELNMWKVHSSQYNFLPRLNLNNSQLQLRRAHHDLQFYVAAFSYLRHAQLHYDYEFRQTEGVMSIELKRLRSSARNILCFIEEAINATNILYAPSRNHHHRLGKKRLVLGPIKTVPRIPMEKRLMKFQSPVVEQHNQAVLAGKNMTAIKPQERPPQKLDALFLKYQYLQYLKQMTQLLTKQRKRNCTKTSPKKAVPRPKSRQSARLPQGT